MFLIQFKLQLTDPSVSTIVNSLAQVIIFRDGHNSSYSPLVLHIQLEHTNNVKEAKTKSVTFIQLTASDNGKQNFVKSTEVLFVS